MDHSFNEVAEAFSLTAEKYDRFAIDHPNLTRMRSKVYSHLMRHLEPGSHILELNAGTGSDAVYLAQQGFTVHATDIAPGMLERIRQKVDQFHLEDRVKIQECSFTHLEEVTEGPFDAVFSDLGGLNCIPDLRQVIEKLPQLLKPGGLVAWVLMPTVCLWELAAVFSGDFHLASRRLSRRGTLAHLEGKHFMIYYFSPTQALSSFSPGFTPLEIEGISIFAPPAESKKLAQEHPRLYRLLCWLDDHLAHRRPFRSWGDFYILTLRYSPD
jgi:ubiquinone/menaquinone biosynthesis C-methylase UbiE